MSSTAGNVAMSSCIGSKNATRAGIVFLVISLIAGVCTAAGLRYDLADKGVFLWSQSAFSMTPEQLELPEVQMFCFALALSVVLLVITACVAFKCLRSQDETFRSLNGGRATNGGLVTTIPPLEDFMS